MCFDTAAQQNEWRVSYFEDKEAVVAADQAMELYHNGKFNHLKQSSLNPGFTESIFWLAIEPLTRHPENNIFVVTNPHINKLLWYEEIKDTLKQIWISGDHLPFNDRPIIYTHFAFPLNKNASVQLLKIDKRHESLQIPFQFLNIKQLQAVDLKETLMFGLFSGIVIILLALSFYLYVNTRETIYILFFLQSLFQSLWWVSDTGFGFRYIWFDLEPFANRSRIIFTSLGSIFLLEFIITFIQLKATSWLVSTKRVFQTIPLVITIFTILPIPFLEYPILIYIITLATAVNWIFTATIILLIILYQRVRGVEEAKVLVVSYTPYLLFILIFLSHHFGIISVSNDLLSIGLPLSSSMTMMILLFGITMIFNRHRTENIKLLTQLNEQSTSLTRKLLEVQDKEREDIGKTLHDEVAAKLSVAQLNLSTLKNKLDFSNQETFEEVHNNLSDINSIIRNISHRLFSEGLEKYGLKASLEDFFKSIQSSRVINIEHVIDGFSKVEQSSLVFRKSVYRIILELTNNIIKHAYATHIFVQVLEVNDVLTIFIEDNGKGFETNCVRDGFGLQLLKAQTLYYKGHLDIKSEACKGTSITVEFRIQNHEATEHIYS